MNIGSNLWSRAAAARSRIRPSMFGVEGWSNTPIAQDLQAFDVELRAKDRKTRCIATRPGKREVLVSEQRVGAIHYDRDGIRRGDACGYRFAADREDSVRVGAHELGGDHRHLIGRNEARVDHKITSFNEAELRKLRNRCLPEGARHLSRRQQRAEAVNPFGRLCPYATRPCGRAERSDDLPPPHSITSSARSRRLGGISSPSARAAPPLITSSSLVGCSTGRSAGLAPLNILST